MTSESRSPAGRLIEAKRKALRPKPSQRDVADLAGIKEGRWRQIVNGFQTVAGQEVPDDGPAVTVARMARAVRVTPAELRDAGRPDAAEILAGLPPLDDDTFDPVARLVEIRAEITEVISKLRLAGVR